ncbi:hypothetical protein ENSA7_54920 [Enhygromyxa salina]|uniref:Uncharacterized protein n=1 Tax=Enhygromyxa salina TaxID=215803 RepID=A0A2S9YC37_9BACT|nr:hypothetical protein ENSA7_54920 [Enhygromyxa salina]
MSARLLVDDGSAWMNNEAPDTDGLVAAGGGES